MLDGIKNQLIEGHFLIFRAALYNIIRKTYLKAQLIEFLEALQLEINSMRLRR